MPQDTCYIRPLYPDWVSQQIYQTHRNKQKEAATMGRQRNLPLVNEQEKSPEKELNEMEASYFIRYRAQRMLNSMKKDTVTIKKKQQSEMKNTI